MMHRFQPLLSSSNLRRYTLADGFESGSEVNADEELRLGGTGEAQNHALQRE
jgi:hypothetical protein